MNEIEEISKGLRDVRVKYLDEEDIKDLGFVRVERLDPNRYQKFYNNNKVNLLISQKDGIIYETVIQGQYGNSNYFLGAIKNKSELKNILNKAGKIVKE